MFCWTCESRLVCEDATTAIYLSVLHLIFPIKFLHCILRTPLSVGIAAFEMEYGHWVDEQNRQISEMRNALNSHISDIELRMLVDGMMNHYAEIYRMKSAAAKTDVFYVMSGMWKTTAERFFLWIGGFRPSELLKVIVHI